MEQENEILDQNCDEFEMWRKINQTNPLYLFTFPILDNDFK